MPAVAVRACVVHMRAVFLLCGFIAAERFFTPVATMYALGIVTAGAALPMEDLLRINLEAHAALCVALVPQARCSGWLLLLFVWLVAWSSYDMRRACQGQTWLWGFTAQVVSALLGCALVALLRLWFETTQ